MQHESRDFVFFIDHLTPTRLHSSSLSSSSSHVKLLRSLPINAPVDNFIASMVQAQELTAFALSTHLFRQQRGAQSKRASSDIRHSGRTTARWERGDGQKWKGQTKKQK